MSRYAVTTQATLGVLAATGGMAWAVRGRSSQVFAPSVWRGKAGSRSIALTFDDGPSPGSLQILRILAEYRVPATFFQCGANVLRHPDIAREIAGAGHELGNHSQTHPMFALRSSAFIEDEFTRAQETIIETAGVTPQLLRAPYGVRWPGFGAMQRKLGLTGAMWTVIGRDWKLPAEDIAHRVVSRVRGGDIICLHDGRATLNHPDVSATVEAVRSILPELLRKGYHFETVTQLIWPPKPVLTT